MHVSCTLRESGNFSMGINDKGNELTTLNIEMKYTWLSDESKLSPYKVLTSINL
jgi:hypothetical protein